MWCNFLITDNYSIYPEIRRGCQCLPSCERVTYDVTLSSAKFPADPYIEVMNNVDKWKDDPAYEFVKDAGNGW